MAAPPLSCLVSSRHVSSCQSFLVLPPLIWCPVILSPLALSPHVLPPLVSSGLVHSGLVPAVSGSLLEASWGGFRASAVKKPGKLHGLGASTP